MEGGHCRPCPSIDEAIFKPAHRYSFNSGLRFMGKGCGAI